MMSARSSTPSPGCRVPSRCAETIEHDTQSACREQASPASAPRFPVTVHTVISRTPNRGFHGWTHDRSRRPWTYVVKVCASRANAQQPRGLGSTLPFPCIGDERYAGEQRSQRPPWPRTTLENEHPSAANTSFQSAPDPSNGQSNRPDGAPAPPQRRDPEVFAPRRSHAAQVSAQTLAGVLTSPRGARLLQP